MSKLVNAALVAALGFGLNAAHAQNVESDKDKAHKEDKMMQEKERGATSGANQGQAQHPDSQKQTGQQTQGQSQDQAGQGSTGQSGQSSQDTTMPVPAQSADTVGKPSQREPTGQGHGVKEQNEQSGQSGQSGQGTDQPTRE
jgi:hypothetical protein